MGTINTLDGQSVWDLVTQYYGDIEDSKKIISQFTNISESITPGTAVETEDTNNNIVALFTLNKTTVATVFYGEDTEFEYSLDFIMN